jgi:hypothetical protein
MIHPQDERSLQRMLGESEIPTELVAEYELRLSLYHRDGNSGPLGTVGMIDLVRSLGLGRKPAVENAKVVSWRDYPNDGSVRVEARFFGEWMPGVYLGFVDSGTIAVRIDGDAFVKECRPDMVRIAKPEPEANDDIPDSRASLLESPKQDEPDVTEPKAERIAVPQAVAAGEDEVPDVNWSTVKSGSAVWAEVDGDYVNAEFVEALDLPEGTTLVVRVSGEDSPRHCPASTVTYAGG